MQKLKLLRIMEIILLSLIGILCGLKGHIDGAFICIYALSFADRLALADELINLSMEIIKYAKT